MTDTNERLGEIATRLWEARDDLTVKYVKGADDGIKLHGGETMKAPDTIIAALSNGITVKMVESWNGHPFNLKVEVVLGADTLSFSGHTLIHRAWQAIQCNEILRQLGGIAMDMPGVFAHPRKPSLMARLFRRPVPVDTLVHVRDMLARRIEEVTDESGIVKADGDCDIGNGVVIWATHHPERWENEYEAGVFHPKAGWVPISYGRINAVIGKVRARALQRITLATAMKAPVSIASGSRSSELLRIGHLAIGEHPDLVDGGGARIDALVRDHLPALLVKHRKATAAATGQSQREDIDDELEQGLDVVAAALDEALGIRGRERHEDLLTQVRFLRTRHPVSVPITPARLDEEVQDHRERDEAA